MRASVAAALMACGTPQHSTPPYALWGDLRPGQHAVGFEIDAIRYEVSSASANTTRVIPTSIWYPAAAASPDGAMPFKHYVAWYDSSHVPPSMARPIASSLLDQYATGWFADAKRADVTPLLETRTAAHLGAEGARGRFPLLVYVPGHNGTPLTHTVTCEFLASRGYIVVSAPSHGVGAGEQSFDLAGSEAQLRDVEQLLRYGLSLPSVDSARVGAVGFSLGGGLVTLLAMQHSSISAVVSLDGIATLPDSYFLLADSPSYAPATLNAPWLQIRSDRDTTLDLTLLRTWSRSSRTLVTLAGLDHHDFIASNAIARIVTHQISPAQQTGYGVSTRLLTTFLDAHVRDRGSKASGDLSIVERRGVPGEVVQVARFPAETSVQR